MGKLVLKVNPKVREIFSGYPDQVRDKMEYLRDLVIETAEETESIDEMEVTLKWGEPSFVTDRGSTLRMDWKPKFPDQNALYSSLQAHWSIHLDWYLIINFCTGQIGQLYLV